MTAFQYKVIDDKNRKIELTYEGVAQIFQLKVKRSFVVLTHLAQRYPEFMNIHDLDNIYNDPNKALSDLKLADGWNGFIDIERRQNRVIHALLNVQRLFSTINTNTEVIRFYSDNQRSPLSKSQKQRIFERFNGRCNITGIELRKESEFDGQVVFMKKSQIPAYDHRQPLFKTGADVEHNLQLISEHANQEKNKICNSCTQPKCIICALAHPEKVSLIHPTNQDISILRRA